MGTSRPYRRAYIGGTFDLFHQGHSNLLYAARKMADEVVVALNTDEFAERYKRRPVQDLEARMWRLRLSLPVDLVVVNVGDEDSKVAIEVVRPDLLVHGNDWRGEALFRQMGLTEEWLDERGIDTYYPPYTPGISTTQLLEERTCQTKTR